MLQFIKEIIPKRSINLFKWVYSLITSIFLILNLGLVFILVWTLPRSVTKDQNEIIEENTGNMFGYYLHYVVFSLVNIDGVYVVEITHFKKYFMLK